MKAASLSAELAKLGVLSEVKFTERAGHAVDLARTATPDLYESVVAVGGDGTLREVAEGLAGRLALAVFPTGTANVLARELGVPFGVRNAARMIEARTTTTIDTAVCNDRRVLFVVGAGFDAAVLRELEAARMGSIQYMSYLKPILRSLLHYAPAPLSVAIDGGEPQNCDFVLVSNTRYYAGPFVRFAAGPELNDGIFEIYLFQARSMASLALSFVRGSLRLLPGGNVRRVQGKKIQITAPHPVPFQIDGDSAGFTPATIEVAQRSLPVIIP